MEFVDVKRYCDQREIRNNLIHCAMTEPLIVEPILQFGEGSFSLYRSVDTVIDSFSGENIGFRFRSVAFESRRKHDVLPSRIHIPSGLDAFLSILAVHTFITGIDPDCIFKA